MDRDEKEKWLLELERRLWFCERMIFISKKRRGKGCFAEFFHFLANVSFLTIGIHGLVKIINHSCNCPSAIAFSASLIIGLFMLLESTSDHFLLKDITNSMRTKKKIFNGKK